MKFFFTFILILHLSFAALSQLPLIPLPSELKTTGNSFVLDNTTRIFSNVRNLFERNYLIEQLTTRTGISFIFSKDVTESKNNIFFKIDSNTATLNCSYYLSCTKNRIIISAINSEGIFYGIQTLLQLIPFEKNNSVSIPCLEIKDKPRFSWRGMHLDVSRHFFPKEFIKRYIDILAMYKMNVFHWHLTDDQGWRIEIKKYPKLTSVGAWREGSQIGKYNDRKFDSIRYGGFYTQEEIKEIVNYANDRHVTIVPEIEMPGHSLAALAAYPELSCKDSVYGVAKGWGVFEDVYCPKEETFKFLENVLSEVMELFPSKYIHIGGDECPKESWKRSEFCQRLIKKESLKDENELQSYFIRRVEKFVNSKGRQIIGWDEILEGGLAPNAAVMSWRGTDGGIAAAKQKHFVVMTPGQFCYFDHYQSLPDSLEPIAIGGYTSVEKVYSYDPVTDSLNLEERKYILGAQGNVWTEYITTPEQVEYMALPRMCALAEVLWLEPEKKNFEDFKMRLNKHFPVLDQMKVNYAKHLLNKK